MTKNINKDLLLETFSLIYSAIDLLNLVTGFVRIKIIFIFVSVKGTFTLVTGKNFAFRINATKNNLVHSSG